MDKQKQIPNRPSALGKGLASLIPAAATPTPAAPTDAPAAVSEADPLKDRHPGISMAAVEEIVANEFQPRKTFNDDSLIELSDSIRANGLIQPLIVRKAAKGYQLIAGERRLRAAKLAGVKYVPIVIKRTTDKESLELAVLENIQREDLNCVETAEAYLKLIHEFNYKQEELAARLGKDRSSIANHLRILKLPEPIRAALKEEKISYGHGKVLGSLEDTRQIEKIGLICIENKWSVRELENYIQKIKNLQQINQEQEVVAEQDPIKLRLKNLTKDISNKLSTKVQLKGDGKKGKFIIEYFSEDDFERVLNQVLR